MAAAAQNALKTNGGKAVFPVTDTDGNKSLARGVVITNAAGEIIDPSAPALPATAATAANQTTQITAEQAMLATLGATTGAKVVTDANGSIQQYLRGLVTFFANALGAGTAAAANRVTLASNDPAVATLGATTGAAVITDVDGTIQQYLRGLIVLTLLQNTYVDGIEALATRATSTSRIVSAANSTNATVAKASAGTLFGAFAYNAAASVRFLKIYDKATTPDETDTPKLTLVLSVGNNAFDIPRGLTFASGISYRLTTAAADNSADVLTAADVLGLNVIYV